MRRPPTPRSTSPPATPCGTSSIGMSDGLTVPFALAAGLSGAVDSTAVIITAGLAEIAAGSIAMGLGGVPRRPQRRGGITPASGRASGFEVREKPLEEEAEIHEMFRKYGLTPEESENRS